MTERGEALRFAFEAQSTLRIRGEVLGQDLDRDDAIQSRIASPIDFAHSSGADGGEDLVWAESSASRETHFFSAASQFSTTVIGEALASSTTVFSRNRPSGATTYCDSPGEIPAPLASRVGKSGTGVLASTVWPSALTVIDTAISRLSGAT